MEQLSNLPKGWKYGIGIAIGLAILYIVYVWYRNRSTGGASTLPLVVGGTPSVASAPAPTNSSNSDVLSALAQSQSNEQTLFTGLEQQITQSQQQSAQTLAQALNQETTTFRNIINQQGSAESQNISSLQSAIAKLGSSIAQIQRSQIQTSAMIPKGFSTNTNVLNSLPNSVIQDSGPQESASISPGITGPTILSPSEAFQLSTQPGGSASLYESGGTYTGPTINIGGTNYPTYGQPANVVQNAVQSGLQGAALRSYLTGAG